MSRVVFEWEDGLPCPRWGELSAVDDATFLAAVHEWLAALGRALDGDYETVESESFLVLAPARIEVGRHVLEFAERCRSTLELILEDLADFEARGKTAILYPGTREDYYRYVCRYYPDGEWGGSAGMHIRTGYSHVVLYSPKLWDFGSTIAHELTHVALRNSGMPLWMEEGLAQLVEHQMTGHEQLDADPAMARDHRRFWSDRGLNEFWSGESFAQADDVQTKSYELAKIVMRVLVEDSKPRWFGRVRGPRRRFLAFLRDARYRDAGDASAREHLGHGVAALVGQFLGQGDWTPEPPPAPKALLLDADGVIQRPGATWRSGLEALCPDPAKTDEFLAEVFAAEKPCATGARDFRDAVAEVLARWQSSVPVDDALAIWSRIEPDIAVLDLVKSLRTAGVVVALATNQQRYRAEFMRDGLGYAAHFDHLLFSCELGAAKPDAGFFAAALERLGVKPEEALFIDDHEANVEGARLCGLDAEQFHLSTGPERLAEIFAAYGLPPTPIDEPMDA